MFIEHGGQSLEMKNYDQGPRWACDLWTKTVGIERQKGKLTDAGQVSKWIRRIKQKGSNNHEVNAVQKWGMKFAVETGAIARGDKKKIGASGQKPEKGKWRHKLIEWCEKGAEEWTQSRENNKKQKERLNALGVNAKPSIQDKGSPSKECDTVSGNCPILLSKHGLLAAGTHVCVLHIWNCVKISEIFKIFDYRWKVCRKNLETKKKQQADKACRCYRQSYEEKKSFFLIIFS